MNDVDFGYRTHRWRSRRVSLRIPMRLITVSATLAGIATLAVPIAIQFGDYPLTLSQVITALTGAGEGFWSKIVLEWRLPVAVAALVFGALLGVGGAIFQSLTRNPLGSPDVIGFDAGSYTGVVLTMLLLGATSYWPVAAAALVGGLATAFVVYVLAYRGGIQGFRLIIVGIAVSAVLGSINAYLITRAEIDDAMAVGFWGAGSLSRITWSNMAPALWIAAGVLVTAALLAPALRTLELGDDAAVTQGLRVGRTRLALIATGVATSALVTAAAGPISFIALVSPQLARRITRTPGVSLLAAAAMGAALLSGAHLLSLLISQVYRTIPVGLLTVCLGGIYLMWLLVRESRTQNGVRA